MVDAILVGTEELLGKGESAKYLDSIKTLVLLTDGVPTLPSGDCIAGTEADTDLTINAARQAGNLGISVPFLLSVKKVCPILALLSVLPERAEAPTPQLRDRPMSWL
jgi:hypothetical protein